MSTYTVTLTVGLLTAQITDVPPHLIREAKAEARLQVRDAGFDPDDGVLTVAKGRS